MTSRRRFVGEVSAIFVAAASLAAGTGPAATAPQGPTPFGVVVESVAAAGSAAKAGIQAGDVILAWVGDAGDATRALAAPRRIHTPFDLAIAEIEDAARGPVALTGTRNGEPMTWTPPPGPWRLEARPSFDESASQTFAEGQKLIAAGDVTGGTARWRAIDVTGANGAWRLARVAAALAAGDPMQSQAAFREAVDTADRAGDRVAMVVILLQWGEALRLRKLFDDATEVYERAQKVLPAETPTLFSARILQDAALLSSAQGNLARAEELAVRALDIIERLAPRTYAAAQAVSNAATFNLGLGKPARAEELLRGSLTTYERVAPDAEFVAAMRTMYSDVLRQLGRLDDADREIGKAFAVLKQPGRDELALADAIQTAAIIAYARGNFPGALAQFRQALEIRTRLAPESLKAAHTMGNIGALLLAVGDLDAALEWSEKALREFQRIAPGSLEEARGVHNLGELARVRGDLATAAKMFARAIEIRAPMAPRGLDQALSHNNLGLVLTVQGDLDAAEVHLKRGLEIRESANTPQLVASSLNNLAKVAYDRGNRTDAIAYFSRALDIQERLAPGSLDVARSLNNLGANLIQNGKYAEGEEHVRRALEIRRQRVPGTVEVASTLNNLSASATLQKQYERATTLAEEAIAILNGMAPGTFEHAATLHNLAGLYREQGDFRRAATSFVAAIDSLERQRARLGGTSDIRASFLASNTERYRDAIQALVAVGDPAGAFHIAERSRARTLLEMMAERDLVFAAELPAEIADERRRTEIEFDRVQAALAAAVPGRDATRIDQLQSRLRELRAAQERIAARIKENSPRVASLQYPEPLTVSQAHASLPPGTLYLSYSLGRERSTLFVIDRGAAADAALQALTLPIGEAALREKVQAFRRLIEQDGTSRGLRRSASGEAKNRAALVQAGRELYDLLVLPAEQRLARSDRILISADGPLHSLPFAALVRPGGRSEFLVEWKPLHFVVSATVYAELRKSRRAAPTAADRPAIVAFGDPVYQPLGSVNGAPRDPELSRALERGGSLVPLPGTRREVRAIARQFGAAATTYLGAAATEEQARAVGKGVRYLHFATHGLLDARFPLSSAIALSIPAAPADGQANGLLQAWEVLEHVRLDADLVTLSGCETGLGQEMGGEGLIGLVRAFHHAGARAVLASMWSVADDSTAVLMERFYHYLRSGESKDVALRNAQIEILRGRRGRQFAHPYYWAAFGVMGDSQ